jgi:ATP-dependent Lon protease
MSVEILPLLPLRDTVIFPGMVAPIFVGREASVAALHETQKPDFGSRILIAVQKNHELDFPRARDIYEVGVLARVLQIIKLPNNSCKILVEVLSRVILSKVTSKKFMSSCYTILHDDDVVDDDILLDAVSEVLESFKTYVDENKKVSREVLKVIEEEKNHANILNIVASHIMCPAAVKQSLLEETNLLTRAERISAIMEHEIQKLHTEQVLHQKVKKQMEKTQRDYYLNEQMKVIQKELGDGNELSDLEELEKRVKSTKLSKNAKEKCISELKKLKSMNPMSAESSVIKNYLDTILGLPWGKFDKSRINIKKAEQILDRDHYGLEKVKSRIIEYLSVLQRTSKIKGPILCLIGPPGVGKTSLVKSIAEAVGRKYEKLSLGGVRDESEIRGHRRTYLGSMPGKIITLLKKAKTSNPVILLDEIDKMGSDFRGDPASALLEVLDPEQNHAFADHYLEVEYDVSDVMFIATANTYNLPRALIDRMEVVDISGYIESEKLQIANNYLVSKQIKMHGIKQGEIEVSEDALLNLIRYYTKESGVRSLDRKIGALVRKSLKRILRGEVSETIKITADKLEEYLGAQKYRFGLAEEEHRIGAVTGLAYTELGGDLLTIEAVSFPGKGEVKTTGKLGDVMKESASAAYSCFRTCADDFGLKYENYKDMDIHVHVPEGAVPKDGPSAGIAIFTTIVSRMTNRAVKREIAMTGEITLRGKVLPIGGLKEKLLAAARGGIKTVLIPEENLKELREIPEEVKQCLEILPVSNVMQVLDNALVNRF